jgi:DNA-binding NtrC family response regulator
VRELEHCVEQARWGAEGGVIGPADLPHEIRAAVEGEAAAGGADREVADLFYDRIVEGGESFWDVVRSPLMRREVSKKDVRRLIRRAYDEAGGSYKGVARLFHMEEDHKKLLDFLGKHDLRAPKRDA